MAARILQARKCPAPRALHPSLAGERWPQESCYLPWVYHIQGQMVELETQKPVWGQQGLAPEGTRAQVPMDHEGRTGCSVSSSAMSVATGREEIARASPRPTCKQDVGALSILLLVSAPYPQKGLKVAHQQEDSISISRENQV